MDQHKRKIIKSKSTEKCSYSDSESNTHDDAIKNIKQNSNSTKSCKKISKLVLPDDLMFQIFTSVPLNCLINSARYVCKSWNAIIRNSNFVEACERRKNSKPGIYVDNRESKSNSYLLIFKNDVNDDDQFERIELGTPEKFGHVISSFDGILLLKNSQKEMFLVNPILKCWLSITPFPNSKYRATRRQCTITCVPHTTKFKLFHVRVVNVSGAFWCICYVLRIGIENSWIEITRKETYCNNYLGHQLLYSGANELYWITKKEVFVMDVDKETIVRDYPHPPVLFRAKYFWMRNHLSCIAYKSGTYQIYILDFDSGKWSSYHDIAPFYDDNVFTRGFAKIAAELRFSLWINDRIIFRVRLHQDPLIRKKGHFCYNVKTRQLTKIEDIDVGDFKVWLHTNSLVLLPNNPA